MGSIHPTGELIHDIISNNTPGFMYPLSWFQINQLIEDYNVDINKTRYKTHSNNGIESVILGSSSGTHINFIRAFRVKDQKLCNDDDCDKPFIIFEEYYWIYGYIMRNNPEADFEITYIEGKEFRWVTNIQIT